MGQSAKPECVMRIEIQAAGEVARARHEAGIWGDGETPAAVQERFRQRQSTALTWEQAQKRRVAAISEDEALIALGDGSLFIGSMAAS